MGYGISRRRPHDWRKKVKKSPQEKKESVQVAANGTSQHAVVSPDFVERSSSERLPLFGNTRSAVAATFRRQTAGEEREMIQALELLLIDYVRCRLSSVGKVL
jgi:hypothetical protein